MGETTIRNPPLPNLSVRAVPEAVRAAGEVQGVVPGPAPQHPQDVVTGVQVLASVIGL